MTRLGEELRRRFKSPKDLIEKLGLDASLLQTENQMSKPTKFANFALQFAAAVIKPILAKDAQIDLMPIFKDVTSKNFDAKKMRLALDGALKGKLAKDAEPNMGHVATMLDHIGSMAKPETADASVSPEQHGAMEAAAHGESNLGIPPAVGKEFAQADKGKTFDAEPMKAFMKEKGMSEDDINHMMGMLPKAPATDESPEEKAKREEEEKKKAAADAWPPKDEDEEKKKAEDARKAEDAKRAEDAKKAEDAMKGMVTKDEMNKAITAAVAAQREGNKALNAALKDVQPIVGDLAMSFDSAEQVYRHVAKMKGVQGADTIHASALPTIVGLLPKAGARPAPQNERLAQDSAAASSFDALFPDAAKIAVGSA